MQWIQLTGRLVRGSIANGIFHFEELNYVTPHFHIQITTIKQQWVWKQSLEKKSIWSIQEIQTAQAMHSHVFVVNCILGNSLQWWKPNHNHIHHYHHHHDRVSIHQFHRRFCRAYILLLLFVCSLTICLLIWLWSAFFLVIFLLSSPLVVDLREAKRRKTNSRVMAFHSLTSVFESKLYFHSIYVSP